ncbi:PspC domain-containing protein [Aridibaculum aurantiacum]|uniref:PspC domain-containing protein n=1 Tax=Aridibaculum aurantiacum TaxID=2810307 RepID=UPI001A95BA3A|nr:PspC domain-containing protein [Aridibaculum aurantiacum]
MKKVININFQGRVIPIEETAYDMLKQYVDSLRLFFATEEGKDEIINDIEGRIAELFEEVLKKGSTCVTDADVNNIINSMGRPEDFEADEEKVHTKLGEEQTYRSTAGDQTYTGAAPGAGTTTGKRLYRDENNKVLGGVCSGIANYFNIDPVVTRILFILFFGVAFWVYLVMWIAVPSSSSVVLGAQRKRLFRDTENKMLAGVCSGLAQYFNVQVWIPRVLFLIPFLSVAFRWGNWGFWDFPHFLSFSFSPGSIVVYIILWLVIPEAKSAADKLEMKGEKVDLNNIKSTIQSDLEGFKDRAQAFGNEVKERAQVIGENIGVAGARVGAEAASATKRTGSGLGRVIVVLLKVFAYFIIGCIVFGIVVGLFALGVALTGLLPVYSYVLDDGWQQVLAWGALLFFIWVPVIAIVTAIIRRIANKRGGSNVIRMSFLALWIVGIICFVNLLVSVYNDFRSRNIPNEEVITLANPRVNKLEVKAASSTKYYNERWLRFEPFADLDEDSVFVRNIRMRIVKATGDSFQVYMVRMANGSNRAEASATASRIKFDINQIDTVLALSKGIPITRDTKFRNQQVIVTVAVPVGKRIYIHENLGWNHERIDIGDDNYWDWERNEETRSLDWRYNVEYVMTDKGLERVDKSYDEENQDGESDALEQYRKSREQIEQERQQKLRELEELDRELQQPVDTLTPAPPAAPGSNDNRYRYTPRQRNARTAISAKTTEEEFPAGAHNLLMINLP